MGVFIAPLEPLRVGSAFEGFVGIRPKFHGHDCRMFRGIVRFNMLDDTLY
jgi:hypothetical protein